LSYRGPVADAAGPV